MSEDRPSDILGGLPRSRPQRRSDKRTAPNGRSPSTPEKRSAGSSRGRSEPLRQPRQPGGTPPKPPSRRPAPPSGTQVVSTVVQAAAELVEIGLSAGARTVRDVLGRLPRP